MPTENRSSNTEQMVSVPRSAADVALKLIARNLETRANNSARRRNEKAGLAFRSALLAQPAAQHQGEPAVVVPEGYCLMPRQLTAENGAKALLLGEFKLQVTRECPECQELEEPLEGCEVCDGEGEYAQRHTIPWDQIKFIYSEAVKGLALQPNAVR